MIPLIAGGAAAVMLIAVGAFLLLRGHGGKDNAADGSGPGGAHDVMKEYEAQLSKVSPIDVNDQVNLAKWCAENGLDEKERVHLEVAAKKDPTNKYVAFRFHQVYMDKACALKPADTTGHMELAKWCKERGLADEMNQELRRIVILQPDNADAQKMRGRVQVDGRWEPKELADEYNKLMGARSELAAKLGAKTERERKVFYKVKDLESVYGETFIYADSCPFLVCIEKSPTYDPKITMGLFEDVMKSIRDFFLGQYGEMLGMKDMSGEVLVVWIWKDKRTYHEKTGAPPFAGGHYDHQSKNLYVYKGTDDIYGTLFHEGTHMLVDFARQGIPESGLFWFTEGMSTYFQGWKRDAKGNIVHGMPAKDWYQWIKAAVTTDRAEHKYEPLEKFMSLDYTTFMKESYDPRANPYKGIIRYGQAWSLLWFLNNAEGGKYKSKWEDYLKREIAGKGGFAAVKEVFGDLNKLEEEWKAYVKALVLE